MSWILRTIKQTVFSFLIMFMFNLSLAFFLRKVLGWDREDVLPLVRVLSLPVFLLASLLQALTSGNRSTVKVKDSDRDQALATPAPDGYALVYVLRTGQIGWATGMDVSLDGLVVAQLKSPRFTRLIVTPGQHLLSVQSSVKGLGKKMPSHHEFTVESGETAVFSFETRLNKSIPIAREPSAAIGLAKLNTTTMVEPDARTPLAPTRVAS